MPEDYIHYQFFLIERDDVVYDIKKDIQERV